MRSGAYLGTFGALLLAGCGAPQTAAPSGGSGSGSAPAVSAAAPSGAPTTLFLLPKKKGVSYFTSCDQGAEKAAAELGVNLTYDGPTDGSADEAAAMIQRETDKGATVIAVSPNDPDVLAPAMKAAMAKGVHVITWDADGHKDAREWFVNQATSEQIGNALVDTLAKNIGGAKPTGDVAIITATLTAANQNEWIKWMKLRLAKYPGLNLVAIKPCDENQQEAFSVAQDLTKAYPNLKGIWGISSVALPGAAEAIKQAGLTGKVQVTGLATPNDMKPYVMDGTVESVILWNTQDLGALTVRVADAVAKGTLKPGATSFDAGSLGTKKVVGDNVLLGGILVFDKSNIGKYDF